MEFGYNLKPATRPSPSIEIRRRISESKKGKSNGTLGRKLSQEHIAKMSAFHKNKVVTKETREKMSKSHLGVPHSEERKQNHPKT